MWCTSVQFMCLFTVFGVIVTSSQVIGSLLTFTQTQDLRMQLTIFYNLASCHTHTDTHTFLEARAYHTHMWCKSVGLHRAQFSRITAIVRLCYSVGQLQLSWMDGWMDGWMGNRANSGWPLYVTSNNKLCLGIQERWRTKSKTKLHLCTFRIWCTW